MIPLSGLDARMDGTAMTAECRRIRFRDGEKNNSGCCMYICVCFLG